jgi:hypothetical protein
MAPRNSVNDAPCCAGRYPPTAVIRTSGVNQTDDSRSPLSSPPRKRGPGLQTPGITTLDARFRGHDGEGDGCQMLEAPHWRASVPGFFGTRRVCAPVPSRTSTHPGTVQLEKRQTVVHAVDNPQRRADPRPARRLGRHQRARARRQDPADPRPLRPDRQSLRLVCLRARQPRRAALADHRRRRCFLTLGACAVASRLVSRGRVSLLRRVA